MADEKPTQKKISHRYAGAADYLRHPHYLRRLRGWVFIAVAAVSALGAVTFSFWGKQEAYSPGPISQNHARFAPRLPRLPSRCGSRHGGGRARGFSALVHGRGVPFLPRGHTAASAAGRELRRARRVGPAHRRPRHRCATCHREHVGRDRMALPSQQTCVACHNNADELKRARRSVTLEHTALAATGENRNLGDGVVRFLAPARPLGTLAAFASYDKGHPPFAYEQRGVSDPAVLKFNHKRHLRDDLPQVEEPKKDEEKKIELALKPAKPAPGKSSGETPEKVKKHRLDCADCHRPGADGAFMQPVKYAQHCAQCHSLQFQPSLPMLRIPHGDAEKVRYFLASREVSFGLALRADGVSDPDELRQRVQLEMQALARRVSGNLTDLERYVFFEGDPPNQKGGSPLDGHPNFSPNA